MLNTASRFFRQAAPHLFVAILCAQASAAPPQSPTVDTRFSTTTLFRGESFPGGNPLNNQIQIYQHLSLHTRDTGLAGLSIEASLWGAAELADRYSQADRVSGDVDLLFLKYKGVRKSATENLELRLGRQLIASSPSTVEHADGLYLGYTLPYGFDVRAYGALVVPRRFQLDNTAFAPDTANYGGDWLVGGRLGYHFEDLVSLGLGYRHQRAHQRVAFDELGWDFSLHLPRSITLLSQGAVDLVGSQLKDLQGGFLWTINRELLIAANYRFTRPDAFIARSSIFAIFTSESQHKASLELSYRFLRRFQVAGQLAGSAFDKSCSYGPIDGARCRTSQLAPEGELSLQIAAGENLQHQLLAKAQRISAAQIGLWRIRLAGRFALPVELTLTADLEALILDQDDAPTVVYEANHQRWSISGGAALSYQLSHALQLLASGRLYHTPLAPGAGSFLLRLIWQLDRPGRRWL